MPPFTPKPGFLFTPTLPKEALDFFRAKGSKVGFDLQAFRMEKDVAKVPGNARTKEGGDKKKQRHGDAGFALALSHYASRQEPLLYDYHRVNMRESGGPTSASHPLRIKAGFGLGMGVW